MPLSVEEAASALTRQFASPRDVLLQIRVTILRGAPNATASNRPHALMVLERRAAIQQALLRLGDGDRAAMPQLVAELWPVLLGFARRGLRDRHDAEDVAQEVLLRICSRVSEFDRRRAALSRAFGIATFEIMTQRRKLQRRRESFNPSGTAEARDAATSVEDDAIRAELRVVLSEALGELSAHELAELGVTDTGQRGAATPAMRKRRQRALDRLRIVWKRIYGEP